jgi:hypothetical protein
VASKAGSSYINWSKRILQQTILVSSITAEIESNISRTDWDENCYKECRKLLQHTAEQIKDVSEDRGMEEIPVLVDLEVQHWIAEALETAAHALGLVGDRITQTGMQCMRRNGRRSQNESSSPSPAAKRARQAVLDAATADPLSDSQLERVVRLALGKRVPVTVETSKAVAAYAAAASAGGDDTSWTPGAAATSTSPSRDWSPRTKVRIVPGGPPEQGSHHQRLVRHEAHYQNGGRRLRRCHLRHPRHRRRTQHHPMEQRPRPRRKRWEPEQPRRLLVGLWEPGGRRHC